MFKSQEKIITLECELHEIREKHPLSEDEVETSEDEVETTADAMTSLIEPILMVVLGGIIAVIVIAMYLPIFNLASAVSG